MREENVGIVGAGALGAAIAGHFARRGIGCAICNSREAASLQHIVESLGGRLRAVTLQEAVAPEIVILAIPRARVPEVMEHVSD